MLSSPEREKLIESLVGLVKKLTEFATELHAVFEKPALGAMALTDAVSDVERAIAVAYDLLTADWKLVPSAALQSMFATISELNTALDGARRFNIQESNAAQQRLQLLTRIKDTADAFTGFAMPFVAYMASKNKQALEFEMEALSIARNSATAAANNVNEILQNLIEERTRVLEIVAAIKKASGELGASQHAIEFEALATAHGNDATRWLVGTVVCSIFTIVWLFALVAKYPLNEDARPAVITQFVMTRVAVFALGSYLIAWAARNYRSHRHLNVLNQHRNKALLTFQTFANASKDDATKNAVLLEATRCIFNAGATGYAVDDKDPSPTQLIETVRTIVEKK